MARIEQIARETPGVAHTVGISGQSFLLQRQRSELRLDVRHARRRSTSGRGPD